MGDTSFGALLGALVGLVVDCTKIDVVVIGSMDEFPSESITSGFGVVNVDTLTGDLVVLFKDNINSNFDDAHGDDSFICNFDVVTEDCKTGFSMVLTADWITGTVDVVTNDGKAADIDVFNNESIVDNLCVVSDDGKIVNIDGIVVDNITGNSDIVTSDCKTDSFDVLTVDFITDNTDVERSDGL